MPTEPYRDLIHISAEPERVFEYFTRPEAVARWIGKQAILDPRPGGEFTLLFEGASVHGRYLTLDPPRYLAISWGRGGSDDFPPGFSTLEVTLVPDRDGTTVHIVHSGLPEVELQKHAAGWAHFLSRLARAAVAGETQAAGGEYLQAGLQGSGRACGRQRDQLQAPSQTS